MTPTCRITPDHAFMIIDTLVRLEKSRDCDYWYSSILPIQYFLLSSELVLLIVHDEFTKKLYKKSFRCIKLCSL